MIFLKGMISIFPDVMKTNVETHYRCVGLGNPTPTIGWTYNGKTMDLSFDSYRVTSRTHGNRLVSNLYIMSKKESRGKKKLECLVANWLGSDSAHKKIHIKGTKNYFMQFVSPPHPSIIIVGLFHIYLSKF